MRRVIPVVLLAVLVFSGCASAQPTVAYLSPLRPEFHVRPAGGDHWTLLEPFKWSVDGTPYEAPAGFGTDFASVPRFLWPVISPYELGIGPVCHDWFYRTKTGEKEHADRVFLACMVKDGIAWWKREAAYYAVSWFGRAAWNAPAPKRAKSIFIDAPPGPPAQQWQKFVEQATGGAP